MPNIYVSSQSKKTADGFYTNSNKPVINIEKEKIAEECMQLKCTVNNLNRELAYFKSEVHKRDRELNNKNKVLQDIYTDSQSNMMKAGDSDMKVFLKLRDNNLHSNMKKQYKELKHELKKKETELENLKRTIKTTRIKEIQNESLLYIEELKKLKAMYEISSQHSAKYE
jgi:hypothetical protein